MPYFCGRFPEMLPKQILLIEDADEVRRDYMHVE
jgi:hypothetical protein